MTDSQYRLSHVVSLTRDAQVTAHPDGSFTLTHAYGRDVFRPDSSVTYQRSGLPLAQPGDEAKPLAEFPLKLTFTSPGGAQHAMDYALKIAAAPGEAAGHSGALGGDAGPLADAHGANGGQHGVHTGWLVKGSEALILDTRAAESASESRIDAALQRALDQGQGHLARYETRGDGFIHVHDAGSGDFRVWVGSRADALVNPDGLKLLAQAGVVALKVGYEMVPNTGGTGSLVPENSHAIAADGHPLPLGEISLAALSQAAESRSALHDSSPLAHDLALSPEAVAYPLVSDGPAGHGEPLSLLQELREHHGFIVSGFEGEPLMADVFSWSGAQIGGPGDPHVTVIPDFNAAAADQGGDVLDMKDLLQPADPVAPLDLSQFLHFETSGAGTVIHISQAGEFAHDGSNVAHTENLQIVLQNVDLTSSLQGAPQTDHQIISELMKVGKLVTDF